MQKYSKEVDDFILNTVLPKLNLTEYNDNNIGDIVDYMFSNIEGPLCDAEEAGDKLSEEDKIMLYKVTQAITEITTRNDWK